jgi:hypothetical protein
MRVSKRFSLLLLTALMAAACSGPANRLASTTQTPAEIFVHRYENADPSDDVASIATVLDRVLAAANSSGPSNILVVFDIDDTLMTMPQTLGGVAWWDWQDGVSKPDARYYGNLGAAPADAQGILYELSAMRPVEGDATVNAVAAMQTAGIAVYALTSRGPGYRDATLRELRKNGIAFSTAPECGPPLCAVRGRIPYSHLKTTLDALYTPERLATLGFKTSNTSDIALESGVVLSAGRPKGVVLRALLASLPMRPTIVFAIDDTEKNVRSFRDAAPDIGVEVDAIHYVAKATAQDTALDSLAEQEAVARNWETLRASICTSTPSSRICPPSPR